MYNYFLPLECWKQKSEGSREHGEWVTWFDIGVYGHVFMQRQILNRSIIALEKVISIAVFLRMHVVNFGVLTYAYHCFAGVSKF
jgi:hypothetical protein